MLLDFLDADLSETSEIAKKKSRIKNHKASLDIFSSPSDMLTKEVDHLSHAGKDRIPFANLHKNSAEFKEQQIQVGFVCQTDYAFQSWDGLEAKCVPTATCKFDNQLLASDNNFLSVEDHFLESRANDNVDNCLTSAWGIESLKDDPDAINESAGVALSCDLIGRGIKKPLLQGCSSRRSLPLERALFVNDEGFEFQRDSFRNDWQQAGAHDSTNFFEVDSSNQSFDFLTRTFWQGKASCPQAFTREITKCEVLTDFDFPSRDFVKSIPSYAEQFIGEDFIESDSITEIGNFGSSHQTSNSDWCSPTSDPLFQSTHWDVEHFKDENACGGSSYSGESTSCRHFVDYGKMDCKSHYGIMSKGSSQDNCSSSCRYNILDFNDCADSSREFCKFLQRHNRDYKFSPEHPDILPNEIGRLYVDSCVNDFTGINKYKRQRDLMRKQECELDHVSKERSRRSCSAPPFYRGKRKFFSWNHPSITKAGKPKAKTFHNTLTYSGSFVIELPFKTWQNDAKPN